MDKLERKFGRYAIKNLSLILIICYGIGYMIDIFDKGDVIFSLICLNPYLILKGQIWRIVTWVIIPPGRFDLWTIIMLMFYYSLGNTLENIWGTFRYNVYIFSGMLFTVAGSFVLLGILKLFPGLMIFSSDLAVEMQIVGIAFFSTLYVNLSIFLAFASIFPENRVLLMFFIPVKVKWMGIAYAILMVYNIIVSHNIYTTVVIIASLLNFVVYFFSYRNKTQGTPLYRVKQAQRKHDYNQKMRAAANTGVAKHKCSICGVTDETNPEMQFRFCSKCNGNYEYCNNHLFSHVHVE